MNHHPLHVLDPDTQRYQFCVRIVERRQTAYFFADFTGSFSYLPFFLVLGMPGRTFPFAEFFPFRYFPSGAAAVLLGGADSGRCSRSLAAIREWAAETGRWLTGRRSGGGAAIRVLYCSISSIWRKLRPQFRTLLQGRQERRSSVFDGCFCLVEKSIGLCQSTYPFLLVLLPPKQRWSLLLLESVHSTAWIQEASFFD